MTEFGGLTDHTVPVTRLTVVIVCGVVVVVIVRSSVIPGFRSWIPSCWPSTVAFALSGTLAKCTRCPSSAFTTRSLPSTKTTVPRSTLTSAVGWPLVVIVSVCTWAVALRVRAETTTPTASTSQAPCFLFPDFIVFPPCLVLEFLGLVPILLFAPNSPKTPERRNAVARLQRSRTDNRSPTSATAGIWPAARLHHSDSQRRCCRRCKRRVDAMPQVQFGHRAQHL